MRKSRVLVCAIMVFLALISTAANAQSYKVLIGDIPSIDPLALLIKTMGEDMNVTLTITKVPMPRLVYMITTKQADIGAPMIALKDQEQIKNLPFDYTTAAVQKMCFVLYTNKNKPIDIVSLKAGNLQGNKIESDPSNKNMFNFTVLPSTLVDGSLKKVDMSRVDGYIMGQAVADPVLKLLKLKNSKRQMYDIYDIVFALQKGMKGTAVDKFISEGLAKVKASGKYDRIMADVLRDGIYDEWQP